MRQAGDDVGIDVIRFGLAADDVTVAPGLQRIQHHDAVTRADERRFHVFSLVARGLGPDQGLRCRCGVGGQRPQQRSHSVGARGDGEARANRFPVAVQDGHARDVGHDPDQQDGYHAPKVRVTWSNIRDGGELSPSILDERSRPGGRGGRSRLTAARAGAPRCPCINRRSRLSHQGPCGGSGSCYSP